MTAEKALVDIYGPHMDRTHTQAFMAGWDAALKHATEKAEVFRQEDTGNNDYWSIYNQGRADALESITSPADPEPSAAIPPAPEPDRPETPS